MLVKGDFLMSLVLELPAELEAALCAEAGRLGLPLPEYALRVLATGCTEGKASSGAQLVAYWQNEGLFGTLPEIADAPGHARAIRQQAEKRARP